MKGSKECESNSQVLHQNFLQRTEKNYKSFKSIQPAPKLLTPIFSEAFYTNWSQSVKLDLEKNAGDGRSSFCSSVTCKDGV
jgi:hypothetical protein